MPEDAQLILLDYLAKRYASLKQRLTRVLGNDDLASDALHDTWLRLNSKEDYGSVQNPGAYLMRMTVNIAVNMHRRQRRVLTGDDVEMLLNEAADPAPGPEQLAEVRSDMDALQKFMDRMPERRRHIVFLVHCEELEQREVAERLGVSERTVAYELRRAHESVSLHMNGKRK
jgi:RNA polymerase sigma factor (sigma-70 family)